MRTLPSETVAGRRLCDSLTSRMQQRSKIRSANVVVSKSQPRSHMATNLPNLLSHSHKIVTIKSQVARYALCMMRWVSFHSLDAHSLVPFMSMPGLGLQVTQQYTSTHVMHCRAGGGEADDSGEGATKHVSGHDVSSSFTFLHTKRGDWV